MIPEIGIDPKSKIQDPRMKNRYLWLVIGER
jgi:hypothetical protein